MCVCVCVCVCVCWVGEDQDRKTARTKKRKGKRDRDSDKGRQREREESQRLNRKQQTACMCRDCVWVGEGGQEPLHLRAPGEGIRWLAHLEAARPESWLFVSASPEPLCPHTAGPSDLLHQTWRCTSLVLKPEELVGLEWGEGLVEISWGPGALWS